MVNFGGSEPSESVAVTCASALPESVDVPVAVTGVSKGGGGSGENHTGLGLGEEFGQ